MTERRARTTLMVLAVLGLLVACARSPVAIEDQSIAALGPAQVLNGQGQRGDRVIWGGRIVGIRNLADATEISVVSYPLDRADRPRLDDPPGVRFLLRQTGFLEPVQYAPGRYITVLGTLSGTENAVVDEFSLAHPVIAAEQIHLWPADPTGWASRTRFSIGVGVRL